MSSRLHALAIEGLTMLPTDAVERPGALLGRTWERELRGRDLFVDRGRDLRDLDGDGADAEGGFAQREPRTSS